MTVYFRPRRAARAQLAARPDHRAAAHEPLAGAGARCAARGPLQRAPVADPGGHRGGRSPGRRRGGDRRLGRAQRDGRRALHGDARRTSTRSRAYDTTTLPVALREVRNLIRADAAVRRRVQRARPGRLGRRSRPDQGDRRPRQDQGQPAEARPLLNAVPPAGPQRRDHERHDVDHAGHKKRERAGHQARLQIAKPQRQAIVPMVDEPRQDQRHRAARVARARAGGGARRGGRAPRPAGRARARAPDADPRIPQGQGPAARRDPPPRVARPCSTRRCALRSGSWYVDAIDEAGIIADRRARARRRRPARRRASRSSSRSRSACAPRRRSASTRVSRSGRREPQRRGRADRRGDRRAARPVRHARDRRAARRVTATTS